MELFFSIVLKIIVLIGLFGFSIFVHELGHFLAARQCGMVIDVFSIGFGPSIWKKKVTNTLYKIGCIPVGGYVALPQLDPSGMDHIQSGAEKDPKEEEPREIPPISAGKKIIVSVAGAFGNVLFGILLAWVVYLSPDIIPAENGAVIGYVDENSAAYVAGLRPGDQILKVNGEPVGTWNDFAIECHLDSAATSNVTVTVDSGGTVSDFVLPTVNKGNDIQAIEGLDRALLCKIGMVLKGSSANAAGLKVNDVIKEFDGIKVLGSAHFIKLVQERGDKKVPIIVERNGENVELQVTPRYNTDEEKVMIGIGFGEMFQMAWMQFKTPMAQIKHDAQGIWRILRALTSIHHGEAKRAAKALGGPLAIFFMLWNAIKISILNGVGFIRFLNINLAILNLLPIPVLDGGHVVFALWEGITRRRVHPRVVNVLINTFAVLLIGIMLLLTGRDAIRIPRWIKAMKASEEIQTDSAESIPVDTNKTTEAVAE